VNEDPFAFHRTRSDLCGVTLMNNQHGYIIAHTMAEKPNVQIRELPSMIRVDAKDKVEFSFDELSEAIGEEFDQNAFEEVMSTHYGRMVALDDGIMLFANPEDAAEYLDFDLQEVK
jgi:propane monooxygenase coupling protein